MKETDIEEAAENQIRPDYYVKGINISPILKDTFKYGVLSDTAKEYWFAIWQQSQSIPAPVEDKVIEEIKDYMNDLDEYFKDKNQGNSNK